MSLNIGEGNYAQLPSEIILEILSYLVIQAKLFNSDNLLFKYYFGRFPSNGNVCFLFNYLDWDEEEMTYVNPYQVLNIEMSLNHGKRIDLLEVSKSRIFVPPTDILLEEDKSLEYLESLFRNIDSSIVKSMSLMMEYLPFYVTEWILKRFTQVENLIIHCHNGYAVGDVEYVSFDTVAPLVAKLKNLTSLKIDSPEAYLHKHFTEISRNTPHMQYFTNASLTSVFAAPEIFDNWKDLKKLSSTIYLVRGEVTRDASYGEAAESFEFMEKLKHLKKMSLHGEHIECYGLPICENVKIMRLSLSYASYSELLMYAISGNSQLEEITFEDGSWELETFPLLDFEKLKHLKRFGMFGITDEYAAHLSKSKSIKELRLEYSEMSGTGLDYLLSIPTLEHISYSTGFSNTFFEIPESSGKVTFESI